MRRRRFKGTSPTDFHITASEHQQVIASNSAALPQAFHGTGKIPFRMYEDSKQVSRAVAAEIAALIKERAAAGKTCVLGRDHVQLGRVLPDATGLLAELRPLYARAFV